MAKSIKFNINLSIDGKEQLTTATALVKDLSKAVNGGNTAFSSMCEQVNRVGFAMTNASLAISSIAGTLNNLTAESRSFSGAMAAANTMAGKSGKDFANLKEQVAELSKTIPIARDLLANGLYQTISNGVPEDNWMEYLEQSAKASVGGLANLEEVVKVTATMIKNYGLAWSDAGQIQDKIQLTAKNGVTSFEQLAQALPRVAANASTLGVTVDELMASFATLTGVSGNTAEVSTQLAAIFTALIKPSSEATTMAEKMGIQFNAASIKAAGGMKNFLTQLNADVKRYAATSGMLEQEVYGKLFGSAESLRALTPLTGKLADKFEENVNAMEGSAGTIDEAFKTMGSTGSSQLQKLNNSLGEYTDMLQESIGNFLPYVNFSSQMIITAASVGTLGTSLVKLTSFITSTTAAQKVYAAVTGRLKAVVTAFNMSLTGTAASATAAKMAIRGMMVATGVGAAIMALSIAFDALCGTMDEATGKTSEMTEAEEAYKSMASQTQASLAEETKKLRDLIAAKEDTTAAVRELNSKYGEVFGNHKTAAEWYDTLTKKSQIYARQMGYEAQMKALGVKLAEKQIQLQDNYDKRRELWKSGKAVDTKTWTTGYGTSVSRTTDTEEYSALKDEARELLPTINDLQRQIAITEKKMAECAGQITKIDKASAGHNKTLEVSRLTYAQVKSEIEKYQTKLAEATNDPTEAARLSGILKQLKARKSALEKTYGELGTKSGRAKQEPKFYKDPKTKEQLSKNINYYSSKLNGKDTEEQRALAKSIQLWKEKRAQIELTEKAALVPKEIKTSQDVDTTLDYLNTKKKYAKDGDIAGINRQISQTELAGMALERPGSVSSESTDEEINKEIRYQQKLKETTEGSTEAIDAEIKRLGLLKDKRTQVQKLNDALDEANTAYDKATTVEAKVQAVTNIHDLQSQIDAKSKEKLTLQADVVKAQAKSGNVEALRTVYSTAQQKASRVQQDFQMGIIGADEAKSQIQEINDELQSLPENLKPIKVDIDTDDAMTKIGSLSGVTITSFDSVRQNLQALQELPSNTAKGFAIAGDAANALGGALQQLGSDSEAAKAGMVIAAIGQIVLSFAQALSSCKTWVEWLAFGISGTAQMISLVATVSGFAKGGIVGGSLTTGDKIPVRVNSGEMILTKTQQARLFAIANGEERPKMAIPDYTMPKLTLNMATLGDLNRRGKEAQTVTFRIVGRDLLGAMSNEMNVSRKSGRKYSI